MGNFWNIVVLAKKLGLAENMITIVTKEINRSEMEN